MKKLIIASVLLLSFASCKKESADFDGPGILDIYGSFQMLEDLTANKDSVDFENGEKVYFQAKFNKIVDWELHITGDENGAKKIISGRSNELNQDNATWDGSMTELPLFKKENCSATLYILNENDSSKASVYAKSAKKNSGLVIADFENGIDPAWTTFIQQGADMDFQTKTENIAPEGNSYLNMAGTVNWDWLIGLIDFNAAAYGSGPVMPIGNDADNTYFNCLIYGDPGTNRSLVLFQIKEDDNEDGNFDANNEDEYDYEVWVDWTGWKLVSIKYSDIPTLINGQPAAPKGNKLHEPNKISKISMLHLADPAKGFASTKIDYIIMSDGEFKP